MANSSSQLSGEHTPPLAPSQASRELLELTELFFILRNETNPEMKEQAASHLIEAIRSSQFRGGSSIEGILCQYDKGIPGVSRAYLVQLSITSLIEGLFSNRRT